MVAKGHDFQRVTLVGVVSADAQLGFPDFRAAERTFQLLTQVAGRAGRGTLAGEVLVETHYPEHYAIQLAARQDYPSFFEKELHFRRLMHYPPFSALASLLVRDTKLEQAIRWSRQIGAFLEPMESRGVKVLGPAAAPLARLKREYRFQFLLKSPRRSALHQRPGGMPGVLRGEGNSRARRFAGCGPGEPAVKRRCSRCVQTVNGAGMKQRRKMASATTAQMRRVRSSGSQRSISGG